jgi:fluoroacetyl-CoA thioesterase
MAVETTFAVGPEHAITFADAAMPAVLSTPALVHWLEQTARDALACLLEPGERSVGTEIELRHLAPTPVGMAVTCLARVVQAEGGAVTFQVEARDEHEPIARGLHRRQVIRADRFAQRVARKQPGAQAGASPS